MAKAGFYVVSENEPGSVKCFVCMKPLDGWEREDDPLYVKLSILLSSFLKFDFAVL